MCVCVCGSMIVYIFPSMNFLKAKCNHIFEGHSTDQRRNYRHIVNVVWVRQISIKWKKKYKKGKQWAPKRKRVRQRRIRAKQAHHTHPQKRIKYGGCYLLFYERFELFPNNANNIVYDDAQVLLYRVDLLLFFSFLCRWTSSLFFFIFLLILLFLSGFSLLYIRYIYILFLFSTSKAVKLLC